MYPTAARIIPTNSYDFFQETSDPLDLFWNEIRFFAQVTIHDPQFFWTLNPLPGSPCPAKADERQGWLDDIVGRMFGGENVCRRIYIRLTMPMRIDHFDDADLYGLYSLAYASGHYDVATAMDLYYGSRLITLLDKMDRRNKAVHRSTPR